VGLYVPLLEFNHLVQRQPDETKQCSESLPKIGLRVAIIRGKLSHCIHSNESDYGGASKPSVFVGSSSEGVEFARAVRWHLRNDAEITLWNDGFFRPGVTFIETLVNSLPRFDFAILVFRADDLTTSHGVETFSPRDNVIFELGLFMGRLGRSRTFGTRKPQRLKCRPISPG
jgi:predicted nucleotide-binding protein